MTGYIQRWFTLPQTVTRLWAGKPSLSPIQVLTHEEYGWKSNSRPIDHKSDALTTHTTRPQVQCTVIVLSESQSRSPLDDCDSSLRSDNSIFLRKITYTKNALFSSSAKPSNSRHMLRSTALFSVSCNPLLRMTNRVPHGVVEQGRVNDVTFCGVT